MGVQVIEMKNKYPLVCKPSTVLKNVVFKSQIPVTNYVKTFTCNPHSITTHVYSSLVHTIVYRNQPDTHTYSFYVILLFSISSTFNNSFRHRSFACCYITGSKRKKMYSCFTAQGS